ncbi:MAG TPA: gas vesicle protein GvpO [Gaiellaceae bacterium]
MTENGSHVHDALRTAASAAVVGAAVGAARAYSARRTAPEDVEIDERETEAEVEPEAEHEEPQEQQEEQNEQEEHHEEPRTRGEYRAAVASARALLGELRGAEPESVSYVAPSSGGWVIGLEVVEVRRIPDSTDVLATYEVEIDGDGGVRRFERVRRYSRSEAAHGGGS